MSEENHDCCLYRLTCPYSSDYVNRHVSVSILPKDVEYPIHEYEYTNDGKLIVSYPVTNKEE